LTHHGQQQHQSRRNPKYQQRHAAIKTHHQHDHDDRLNNNATSNMTLPKMMKNKKKTYSLSYSSDIESDLDILDQSEFTHEFRDGGRRRVKRCSETIVHDIEREDELLEVRHSHHYLRNERDSDNDDMMTSYKIHQMRK